MQINYIRRGHGNPLLLVHGLGCSWHTWQLVLDRRRGVARSGRLYGFERCGHYPHWDAPEETARLILETTAE